jgi:murein DD-endopeptidase MepM/ murein hydrolase activator NlpD
MLKKTILFIFIIAFAFGSSGSFVIAEETTQSDDIQVLNKEIADRKDKIKQLEETIAVYKKNIAEKQNQTVSLKNQLSILDNRIGQIKTDVEITQEKIKETELEIEALQLTINDKGATIDRQKRIITKLVQSLHSEDQKNVLEILLTYKNFADFFNQVTYLENVDSDLGRSVTTLRLAKADLENKQEQVKRKKSAYEELQQELIAKQQNLKDQAGYKQTLLTETRSSEQRYQTLLSGLKQQYQVIESEVNTFEARVRKKLEQQNKITDSNDVAMNWPVPSHFVTAIFHDPEYPFRHVFEHSGIDIRAPQGTPVRAAASGYVAKARRCTASSCYAYVILIHTGNISSLYGHLSNIAVADDAFVTKGDVIGYSGGTPGTVGAGPFVTGAHLHFEVRQNGIPVNPLPYFQ